MVAGGGDRVVADAVAAMAGDELEDALDPALAAATANGVAAALRRSRRSPRPSPRWPGASARSRTSSLTRRSSERNRASSRSGESRCTASVSSARRSSVSPQTRVALSRGLRLGLRPGLVDEVGQVAVGVPDDTQADEPQVLADGVGQLVDVPGADPELGLDLGQARPHADPELAVPGVAEELLGVALRARPEVDHRFVAAAVAIVTRLQDQDGVRLAVGAQTGEVGERRVRAEPVVGVVAADLEPAGRDDQPLAGERRGHGVAARGRVRRGLDQRRGRLVARGPVAGDEGQEGVG